MLAALVFAAAAAASLAAPNRRIPIAGAKAIVSDVRCDSFDDEHAPGSSCTIAPPARP